MSTATDGRVGPPAQDLADALLAAVFLGVDRSDVDLAIARVTAATVDLLREGGETGLPGAILARLPSAELRDGRALPDGVWRAVSSVEPAVTPHPTGLAAERAVKRTVAGWIASASRAGEVPDIETAAAAVAGAFASLGADGVAEAVAVELLFEMCVDQMRRTGRAAPHDLALWYQFDHDGHLVPTAQQATLRARLREGCARRAPEFLTRARRGKRSRPERPINVVSSGRSLASLRRDHPIDPRPLRIGLHAKTANVSFPVADFERELMRVAGRPEDHIHSLVGDLLDIAAVTYIADLHVKRQRNLARRLGMLVPVVHDDMWAATSPLLGEMVGFLGRDDVEYTFAHRPGTSDPAGFTTSGDDRCVSLLSGGVDSLAGAVWALEQGKAPVFVSHHASTNLAQVQALLIGRLEDIYGRELPHLSVYLSRSRAKGVHHPLPRPPHSVAAQHLRSFLFLTLGTATALETGIDTVYLFESGPTAVNPQVSEARINTRTAHPHFLAAWSELVERAFGVNIRFENPFLERTKGEVMEVIGGPATRSLLTGTVSCWAWSRVPATARQRGLPGLEHCHHDGECIPCLIRRAGAHRAGMTSDDTIYMTDVFADFPSVRKDTVLMLADNLRFARLVTSLPDADLLAQVPELSVCERGIDCGPLAAMYLRHSSELLACFDDQANEPLRRSFQALETDLPPAVRPLGHVA